VKLSTALSGLVWVVWARRAFVVAPEPMERFCEIERKTMNEPL